jgi:hypothetical protein
MPNRGLVLRLLSVAALLACAVTANAVEMTKITVRVKNDSDKPVDRASVVVRFVEGRSYIKLGHKIQTTYELRTNEVGEATIPSIPQGKIRIQIIAKGYQTFGEIFDVDQEEKTVEIKLNPPQKQYSAHEP